jgi:lipopolysaccharide transport system ATP-binding protein
MQARLTFATAISIDPEIFIVDEALAAGDTSFVNKCMKRVRAICESGATVLLVSHSSGLIGELCDEAIWIEKGRVLMHGNAQRVSKAYEQSVWDQQEVANLAATRKISETLRRTAETGRYETGGAAGIRIVSVDIVDAAGGFVGVVKTGEALRIRIAWKGTTEFQQIYSSMRIDGPRAISVTGIEGYDVGAFLDAEGPMSDAGSITYVIPELALGEGTYWVSASICRHMLPKGSEAILHYVEKAAQFSVARDGLWHFAYIYEPKFSWDVEQGR